jgi:hypothetical protein
MWCVGSQGQIEARLILYPRRSILTRYTLFPLTKYITVGPSRDLLHHQEHTQNEETSPSFLGRRIFSVFRFGTELKCGSRKNANELKMTLDKNPLTWTCSRLVEPPASEHSSTPASARKMRADTNFTMVELFLANTTDCDCDCATKQRVFRRVGREFGGTCTGRGKKIRFIEYCC